MPKTTAYRAVVFDMDGTLVSSPLCFKTIRQELGIPAGEMILEYLAGLPAAELAERSRRLVAMEVAAAREARLIDGAREVLLELRAQGFKVGLHTRNCRAAAQAVVSAFSLVLDHVVTRDDASPKPHPAGLQSFLTRWRLLPHELLLVGDGRYDIECARRADVDVAHFIGGKDAAGATAALDADHVLRDYRDFFGLLRS